MAAAIGRWRFKLTELDDALLQHAAWLVYHEGRPFSFHDFLEFEVDDLIYRPAHGTIRNHFMALKRQGKIEFSFNSGMAFYSLPGRKFGKDSSMTPDRMGVAARSSGKGGKTLQDEIRRLHRQLAKGLSEIYIK